MLRVDEDLEPVDDHVLALAPAHAGEPGEPAVDPGSLEATVGIEHGRAGPRDGEAILGREQVDVVEDVDRGDEIRGGAQVRGDIEGPKVERGGHRSAAFGGGGHRSAPYFAFMWTLTLLWIADQRFRSARRARASVAMTARCASRCSFR